MIPGPELICGTDPIGRCDLLKVYLHCTCDLHLVLLQMNDLILIIQLGSEIQFTWPGFSSCKSQMKADIIEIRSQQKTFRRWRRPLDLFRILIAVRKSFVP